MKPRVLDAIDAALLALTPHGGNMTRRTSYRHGNVDNHPPEPAKPTKRIPPGLGGAAKRNQLLGQAKAAAEGRGPGNWKPAPIITLPRVTLADPADFD